MKTLSLIICLSLAGCAGATKTVTREVIDPVTLQKTVVTTTTTSTFWKSENQEEGHETMRLKINRAADTTLEKLAQIERNAQRRELHPMSSESRAYANAGDQVAVASIRTDVSVADIPISKNFADFAGPNIVALSYLGVGVVGGLLDLDIGGPLGSNSGEGSTSLKNVTAGRDIYINSERNDAYTLAENSAWNGTETNTLSWTTETYTGNSQSSGDGSATAASPTDENVSLF